MSARDRIIAPLRTHPDGLDDDVIAEKLGLSRRQQANSRCRELEREGIVERRSVGGKIQNTLTGSQPVLVRAEPAGAGPPFVRRGFAHRATSASGKPAAPCGHRFPWVRRVHQTTDPSHSVSEATARHFEAACSVRQSPTLWRNNCHDH